MNELLAQGQVIEVKVEDRGAKGDWKGRYKGLVVFIKGEGADSLKSGDVVKVEITDMKPKCAFARLMK